MSLWSYAEDIPESGQARYFRQILIGKRAVSGPIVTTQSVNDAAVGLAFPAAVGLVNEVDFGADLPKFGGIGTWGIQGTTIAGARDMLDERGEYHFEPGRIYNLNGSRFISGPQRASTARRWRTCSGRPWRASRGQRV